MVDIFRETGAQKLDSFDASLWEWQYLRGERGSFVVLAEQGDELCGYYHVLLQPMRLGPDAVLGAMVQDVATLPSFRGRGILRGMGESALEGMRARGVALAYTFPNRRSLPAFIRDHGYRVVATIPVLVAPLDIGPLLERRLGSLGAQVLRGPLGLVTGLLAGTRAAASRASVEQLDDPEEAADLVTGVARPAEIGLDRTARLLNWRYLEKPGEQYTGWGYRSGGTLRAYLITRPAILFSSRCVVIMDLGCRRGDEQVLRELIQARLAAERSAGVELAVTLGSQPFPYRMRGGGFIQVPKILDPRPLDLVARAVSPGVSRELFDASRWHITLGDWDVL